MNSKVNLSANDTTDMADAYQDALLWTSLVNFSVDDDVEYAGYFAASTNLMDHAVDAVNEFLAACAALGSASRNYIRDNPERAGRYLALSRNGHGAGFFEDHQVALQNVARRMGETGLFLDNNNEIDVEFLG